MIPENDREPPFCSEIGALATAGAVAPNRSLLRAEVDPICLIWR
jgi:hypothetical protein